MYVCICNAVSDTDIREAVELGASDLDSIAESLGAGMGCGTCREFAKELIDQTLSQKAEHYSYAI